MWKAKQTAKQILHLTFHKFLYFMQKYMRVSNNVASTMYNMCTFEHANCVYWVWDIHQYLSFYQSLCIACCVHNICSVFIWESRHTITHTHIPNEYNIGYETIVAVTVQKTPLLHIEYMVNTHSILKWKIHENSNMHTTYYNYVSLTNGKSS